MRRLKITLMLALCAALFAAPQAQQVSNQTRSGKHARLFESPMSTSSTQTHSNLAALAGEMSAFLNAGGGQLHGSHPIASALPPPPQHLPPLDLDARYAPAGSYAHFHTANAPILPYLPPVQPPPPPPHYYGSHTLLASKLGTGFELAEVALTIAAVAMGAVIVGAPLVLVYIFITNLVHQNQAGNMANVGGSAISLTGPSSQNQQNGRKKRAATSAAAMANSEQLSRTLKHLVNAMATWPAALK